MTTERITVRAADLQPGDRIVQGVRPGYFGMEARRVLEVISTVRVNGIDFRHDEEFIVDRPLPTTTLTFDVPEAKREAVPAGHQLDINTWQLLVNAEALRRWPTMTVQSEGLALAEEAGEVCRAILKRQEGTRGTADEWTAELAIEIGQAMFVLLNIAALERLEASEVLEAAWAKFRAKPDRETMTGEAVRRVLDPPTVEPQTPLAARLGSDVEPTVQPLGEIVDFHVIQDPPAVVSDGDDNTLSAALLAIVNEQAAEDGLWFEAQTAPEAYLQQELRRLHSVIERWPS